MLLVVIGWSFHAGPNNGMLWAIMGGMMLDLATGAPLGITSLPLMLIVPLIAAGQSRTRRGNPLWLGSVAIIALILFQTIYLFVLVLTGHPVNWATAIPQVAVPLLLLHAVLLPISYFGMAWLSHLIRRPEMRLGRHLW